MQLESIMGILVPALVSIIVSVIGFIASFIAIKWKIKELEHTLLNKFTEAVLLQRLELYGSALEFTKFLIRMPSSGKSFDRDNIKKTRDELSKFLNSKAGLLLSKQSLVAVDDFKEALNLNYGGSNEYSTDQMEKIVKSAVAFRQALRNDINPIHSFASKKTKSLESI